MNGLASNALIICSCLQNLISALLEFPKPRSLRSGSANEKSTLVGIGSSYVLVNNVTEQIVSWAALKHNILPAPGEVCGSSLFNDVLFVQELCDL